MSEKDRQSIGLTTHAQTLLSDLLEKEWFLEGQDAALFCLAYAIRSKVPEGLTGGTETRWAVGNFDESGEIRTLLSIVYPNCSTPVRLMEHLVNEGLQLVTDRIRNDDAGPFELLQD